MGRWAKDVFGKEKFSEIGIVVAGTIKPEIEKKILRFFDKVICSKDSVYHAHLARKNGKEYPVVFNVYGAPAMVDVLTEMHDGGCRIVIFVGYAYGFKNLGVGSIAIPDKSYHFDGIYHHIELAREAGVPDKKLVEKVKKLFEKNKIGYVTGDNISVPAVTFQLPHANKKYQKIKPSTLEMELASCLSRSKDIGIRSAGILIISDNRSSSIGDKTKSELRNSAKIKILKTIIDNLEHLHLPKLSVKKEFKVSEYLASVIEDPNDAANVYRDGR